MAERIAPTVIFEEVPYFSQFASPELVQSIVEKRIPAIEDPRWMESGAKSPEEYELWSWNLCGVVCLKSILQYTHDIDVPTVDLAKRCTEFGGYKVDGNDIDGLFYKPFVAFIKADFDLNGKVAAPLSLAESVVAMDNEDFVIASVHPMIRNPKSTPPRKGGHLVLLTGYDLEKEQGLLYAHDPSGYYEQSQKFAEISFADFGKFFSGRGIIIENPKKFQKGSETSA